MNNCSDLKGVATLHPYFQNSNHDSVEAKQKDREEESPEAVAEDSNSPPAFAALNRPAIRSLPQGIELFSIVSEQKSHNSLGFTRSLNSYNV